MLARMALTDHVPNKLRRIGRTVRPLARAFELWSSAGGTNMSAAVSFYGVLSLAPLLLAIVAILGWWMDRAMLQNAIVHGLGSVVGDLYCHVVIETPVKLTSRQRELLRELEAINDQDPGAHSPRAKSFFEKVKDFFGP